MGKVVDKVVSKTKHVSCQGGNPPYDHPLIYLTINKESGVLCPYCGRKFVLVSNDKDK